MTSASSQSQNSSSPLLVIEDLLLQPRVVAWPQGYLCGPESELILNAVMICSPKCCARGEWGACDT